MKDRSATIIVLLVLAAYLAVSYIIVGDYGITWDEPVLFAVGERYFYFYQTLDPSFLDFKNDMMKEILGDHPPFENQWSRNYPHWYSPLSNTLSALSFHVFHKKLGLLSPIEAHHFMIPILVAVFLYFMFLFVRSTWGGFCGVASVLLLLTMPRFWGHSFSNVRDVPELVFFSLTIFSFARWAQTRRLFYFYLSFALWGCSFATKTNAIWVLPIVVIWLAVSRRKVEGLISSYVKGALIIASGVIVTFCVFFALCPLFYVPPHGSPALFLDVVKRVSALMGMAKGWKLYPFTYIFITTPVPVLGAFFIGLGAILLSRRRTAWDTLMVTWFFAPLAMLCLPRANVYDGIRHFLMCLVPLAIIGAAGIAFLGSLSLGRFKPGLAVGIILLIIVLAANAYYLVNMHPYQTTFFNIIVGGLGGAQEKGIRYANDYWLSSYKAAGEWLQENAPPGAYYGVNLNEDHMKYFLSRDDLKHVSFMRGNLIIPPNCYVVIVPRKALTYLDKLLEIVKTLEPVYQVRRQGGEIMTIYYKEPADGEGPTR